MVHKQRDVVPWLFYMLSHIQSKGRENRREEKRRGVQIFAQREKKEGRKGYLPSA